MDISLVFFYLLGVLVLYFLASIFYVPLRSLLKLILNAVLGGVFLALFNIIGSYLGFYLAINPITALVVGFLGVPGILLLSVLRYLLLK